MTQHVGDGGLLSVFADNVKKYGQEINKEQLDVAQERLINFEGECGDTLQKPAFLNKRFECIMANPPFSIKWEPLENDIRFKVAPVIPPQGKADYAFLLHIIHFLSEKGIAITLNFPGILYRGQREGKIRQWLIEKNYIERIVNIPENTFVDTKIATALVILNKSKTTTDIVFEDKETKQERTVSLEEVRENGYVLSVNTYIKLESKQEEVDPWELEQQARKNMLMSLQRDLEMEKWVCDYERI